MLQTLERASGIPGVTLPGMMWTLGVIVAFLAVFLPQSFQGALLPSSAKSLTFQTLEIRIRYFDGQSRIHHTPHDSNALMIGLAYI